MSHPTSSHASLTSILIPVLNQLPLLKKALASIERCTPEAHEVVIVDNGSAPDVREYLAGLPVRVILNPVNRGFAAAINQAVAAAGGEIYVLLNSDVEVTPGWLRSLHEALEQPDVGLVGPYANYAGGSQQVEVDYQVHGGPDGVARVLQMSRAGSLRDVDMLVAFCLALRRDTADLVGEWDERFGIGNFEDNDYCLRASLLGFRMVIAEDCFVHHQGHATFNGENMAYGELIAANREIFRHKWSDPATAMMPYLQKRLERTSRAA